MDNREKWYQAADHLLRQTDEAKPCFYCDGSGIHPEAEALKDAPEALKDKHTKIDEETSNILMTAVQAFLGRPATKEACRRIEAICNRTLWDRGYPLLQAIALNKNDQLTLQVIFRRCPICSGYPFDLMPEFYRELVKKYLENNRHLLRRDDD
jgi:hypothetical protein